MSDPQNQLEPVRQPKPPIVTGNKVMAIVPTNLDEAWRLSVTFVKAGMVPASYEGRTDEETTSKIMMGIMKGLEVGLKPSAALANIMIVNKRPSLWGDGALALVQNSGKLEWIKEYHTGTPQQDNWTAICEMKRTDNDEVIKQSFSFGEAKSAKLTGKAGPWMSYPRRMLQMRARAFALRDGFADVLQGLGIVEEQKDIPQAQERTETTFLDDNAPLQTIQSPVLIEAQASSECLACNGRGLIEDADGKGPCPACSSANIPAVPAFLDDKKEETAA